MGETDQTFLVTDNKFDKTKVNLGIFVDEGGVYRCGGRLHKAGLSYECKHSATIPKDHHITELIIKDSHSKVFHNERNIDSSEKSILDNKRLTSSQENNADM